MRSRAVRRSLALLLFAVFFSPAFRVEAAPTVGFIEDFPGTSVSSWAGGSLVGNPGTGGYGGAGDGFLEVATLAPGNLGTVSFGAEYAGDWLAAGITQVRCWLTDRSGRGDLLIHLAVSNGLNTWQQNAGFAPPVGKWGLYVVDLTESAFTHTRGTTGTFNSVLQTEDRLHFRHDLAPYGPTPDPIAGAFGLDHILLTNGVTAVDPASQALGSPVLLDPPFPNPARGRVTFTIRQPGASPVTITVFDAAGRRVRQVELAAAGQAPRLWLWDGRDDAGAAAPAGVYRAVARGENGGTSRTVTLLR